MRKRSRIGELLFLTTGDVKSKLNVPPYTETNYGPYTLKYRQFMDDIMDAGPQKGARVHGRWPMKPVDQTRWTAGQPPLGTTTVPDWSGASWDISFGQGLCYSVSVTYWQDVVTGQIAADDLYGNLPLPSGHEARWERGKPSMSSRANLAVFLYELRDIKRMFDILPPKHLRHGLRSLDDWRDALKYVNSQHLNYNFGWKPFIKDVKNVFKGLSSFEDRLKGFVAKQNTEMTRRVRDSVAEVNSTGVYQSLSNGYWKSDVIRKYNVLPASSFQYSYSIPNYSDRELRVRAYLDTLGLHVNPANVWAVLPWSFVVDWFVNVGQNLDRFSNDWVQPWVNLHQACHSQKIEATSEWTTTFLPKGQSVKTQTCSMRTYRRVVGIPQGMSLDAGTLDSDKIRLLLSLFASRVL